MNYFLFMLLFCVPLCGSAQIKIEMQKEISIPTEQSACFPRPEECQLKKDYPDPIQAVFYVFDPQNKEVEVYTLK